ncbi:hypothetical protein [Vreelandella venusta]|uniref:hypothetical protein n=1 Tax=Vreelandella venusta TaxID=44935 RepID=UPI00197A9A39|nr:hypothetical protein [Halomonas venusta]
MSNIKNLKNAKTKVDLAQLLGVKASYLTYVLYVLKPQTQYESFEIPKKSGGVRVIEAPTERLKLLQSRLSNLLQNCIQDINKEKKREGNKLPVLSHGFVREKSIITNAMQHLNKKMYSISI